MRSGMPVKIKAIEGKMHPLACTQGHHMLRDKKFEVKDRNIIAHTTLTEFLKNKSELEIAHFYSNILININYNMLI